MATLQGDTAKEQWSYIKKTFCLDGNYDLVS